MMQGNGMVKPEAFFENADDIINEEEFEESVMERSVMKEASITDPLKQSTKMN